MQKTYLTQIKQKIQKDSSNRIWNYSDFKNIPITSVAKTLSKLTKKGFIKRVAHGLYFHSIQTRCGETIPDLLDIVYLKLRSKGYFICESGLNGFNNIGLTTQVPNVTYLACDHKISKKIPGIIFMHRPKPNSGSAIERIFLDALRSLENIPDTTSDKTLSHLKKLLILQKVHIDDLLISCLKEPPRVRALVGALAQELSIDSKRLNIIRSSFNPATRYYFKFPKKLKYGSEWGIKSVST